MKPNGTIVKGFYDIYIQIMLVLLLLSVPVIHYQIQL